MLMKTKELRQMSEPELRRFLDETRRTVHELAFKAAARQNKNVHALENGKRDIARALTILRERVNS
ncbi:50S ribosomal protein L29 [Candidatus Uhrbacteria bacterium CG10_big_fil_rev_8_21_14_0_10_48_11]|uniref:Large ribosomal subunit protein uL29 n=1 Tax=Candidatus Uhrbacteria bacterium CG10_big_fil_rev_8_21_14_0_10_48_11 TaxID=1975037 RepID=A0A2M8LEZ6_9BACT|nr:MAG: 50S ribosomal protein L29 [Candidatus Uhrbacteria bacterium CG10_big_fil_rev_8_21_14_0_10_48_11]